jgi:protein phosphatase
MSELQISSDLALVKPSDMDTMTLPDTCPRLTVRSFGLTDRGKAREINQDHFLIAVLLKALQVDRTSLPQPKVQRSSDRSHLFVVADGMGGHAGGEMASALAVDSVESFILETFKWFAQCKGKEEDHVLADFQSALGHANARVLSEAAVCPELHGMGTTLTLAYSLNDELFVAHVGDSRCYLCRHGILYRLTRDHTLVEEMVRHGALPAEEAAQHRWRHFLTNAVGAYSPDVKVEVHKVHLEGGDRVLLCSDGLTNMVPEQEINHILQTEAEPKQACRRLVACANEAGGKDNITVVVAHFRDGNQPEASTQRTKRRERTSRELNIVPRKAGKCVSQLCLIRPNTTQDVPMNWDQIKGNWKQVTGKVKEKWGKLTDDDLKVSAGKREQLAGLLQERYDHAKQQAEKEHDEFTQALKP